MALPHKHSVSRSSSRAGGNRRLSTARLASFQQRTTRIRCSGGKTDGGAGADGEDTKKTKEDDRYWSGRRRLSDMEREYLGLKAKEQGTGVDKLMGPNGQQTAKQPLPGAPGDR